MSQTPAAPVQSVLKDTALQSFDAQTREKRQTEKSYTALASGYGSLSDANPSGAIRLGRSDEGNIVNVSEGEDRIVGEVREGNLISTNVNANQYASPEYSQTPSSYMSGGSYSGYANSNGSMANNSFADGSMNGSSTGNPCIAENCHSYYVGYESIFIKRLSDQSFTLSRGRFLDDYDYQFGNRITLGQMLDCTDGVEVVYTGPLKWYRSRVDQSSTSSLDSVLTTNGGYLASQIDTFNGARRHIQIEQSKFQSYEANRRWFAQDIMSTLIGFRSVQLDESFLFDSVDGNFGAGFYRKNLRNRLYGGQIGADIYRPIGQRLSIGSKTRIGLFANFVRGETILANRGAYLLFARDKDIDFAGLIQYGTSARYRILPHLVAVAGYEAWILSRVGTASDQTYTPINPNSGLKYRHRDTVFFHGATGGVEFTW